MMEQLRRDSASLLRNKEVNMVIGYGHSDTLSRVTPVFITRESQARLLVVNRDCQFNLAVYLNHREIKEAGKVAIVAKERDMRTIITLLQEAQVCPENIIVMGIEITENPSTPGEWRYTGIMDVKSLVRHVRQFESDPETEANNNPHLSKTEQLNHAQRREQWQREFSKCIRCYACRQACPLCYCDTCVVEKNQPQWISPNISTQGNRTWNLIRAFHLAGRCAGCGNCERACPMNIPLMTLNQHLSRIVFQQYHYVSGYSLDEKPPLSTFQSEDSNSFLTELP